jgi:predicted dinucleotide-utilizing enzyme
VKSNIAQHEHGVESIVNKTQTFVFVGHHPSAIDHEMNALTLVRLVLFDGQTISSCRASPVNVTVIITIGIISESLEVVILPNTTRFSNTN